MATYPWIPKKGRYRVLGVSREGRDLWVSDLIDPVTQQWKVEVVQSILQVEDANSAGYSITVF